MFSAGKRTSAHRFGCRLLQLVWIAAILFSAAAAFSQAPMPRTVLVLYDGDAGQSERENLIYQDGQTILNYLGLLTEYHDVGQRPLPDDAKMADVLGIITTFTGSVRYDPAPYLSWLNRQMDAGKRIVVMGDLGVSPRADGSAQINALVDATYRKLGLTYRGGFTVRQPLIRYGEKDARHMDFERSLPLFPVAYVDIKPVDPAARVYLQLRRTDRSDSESAVIVTTGTGGFALGGFIYWEDQATFRRQWYLDPFAFFREALGIRSLPAPDPTTLNGLRVAISHIDGDAFTGTSRIDGKSLCAEIIRDRILKTYDFPVTVSVIVGEIDPAAAGSPAMVALAREIFALPNVEPASHSYSHPFYWDASDGTEAAKYPHQYGIAIDGYTHDRKMEIDYSTKYITRTLAPPDKPCRVFLWSGNCLPTAADIAICERSGYLNMNGGDTLFDAVNDSYTSVAPYCRKVGQHYQFYTGQANENILTNLWQGPRYGYRQIITTMERTGAPRRMAPIDVYYHFYSGEYKASLQALESVYQWVLTQDTARMFASAYLEMVEGFLSAAIYPIDAHRFRIENFGKCLTMRFDAAAPSPDLARCRNVIGYLRTEQGLYLSLASGSPWAEIALSTSKNGGDTGPISPFIRAASGWVTYFAAAGDRVQLDYRGFGRGRLELGGLPAEMRVQLSGTALADGARTGRTDSGGRLQIAEIFSGALTLTWP